MCRLRNDHRCCWITGAVDTLRVLTITWPIHSSRPLAYQARDVSFTDRATSCIVVGVWSGTRVSNPACWCGRPGARREQAPHKPSDPSSDSGRDVAVAEAFERTVEIESTDAKLATSLRALRRPQISRSTRRCVGVVMRIALHRLARCSSSGVGTPACSSRLRESNPALHGSKPRMAPCH